MNNPTNPDASTVSIEKHTARTWLRLACWLLFAWAVLTGLYAGGLILAITNAIIWGVITAIVYFVSKEVYWIATGRRM